ncbi:unnamed protein product [Camellia sinensis]
MEQNTMLLKPLSCSLLIFCYILFYMNSVPTFGFTNETDMQALLAIRNGIQDDPFNVFSSWNNSHHFCKWQGVTCSHRHHQRVSAINLSSLKLSGSLSPHIGNLTFLRVIDLVDNNFHGVIPQAVGRLFRIRSLYLGNNSFKGEFPVNVTHCSGLRVINLIKNDLSGKVPIQLGSLPKLEYLDLTQNHFIATIPPALGNLSALRWLYMLTNNLQGQIPIELGKLSNLEVLQLSDNKLTGTIPSALFNISKIHYLALASNQFHGSLPPNLGLVFPKLETILMGANWFSGTIPGSLGNASGLVQISFAENSFTGGIPQNLGDLQQLEVLQFGGNPLAAEKANDLHFLTSLTNCTKLRWLVLYNNQLGGVLPTSIGNLSTKLVGLNLDQNYISGSIPPEIGSIVTLEVLTLNDNYLTGNIPNSIGKFIMMQEIYLSNNKISGKIPATFGNMSKLSILLSNQNMLDGNIPVSLGNCVNLQELDLSQNRLTGMIPKQIVGLPSLTLGLSVAQNFLAGPLPSEVSYMKNIGLFDVSRNQLSGNIPSTLGDCLVLEFLNMEGNHFEGTIPPSFKQLRGIQILDLSNNNLSGKIPSFLGNFSLIQYLNLSYNKFEGEVPSKGVFSNISAFSIGGNSKLCGGNKALQLPACPTKISKKQEKHLSNRVLIIAISVPVCIILLLACICVTLYWKKRLKVKTTSTLSLGNQYPNLSYAELLQATEGFSPRNLIDEGSYGSVYKGILNSETIRAIAVKVLNLQVRGASNSFLAECEALRNIRHRNLVKIITACSSIDFKGNEFKALVFEYISNGSLESWLHSRSANKEDSRNLSLVQRLNIAVDVASALDYLHNHCETPVIHCDLKPSNVLLDDDLSARVSDFGLARICLTETSASTHTHSSTSSRIRGTIGYMAPEYAVGGEASIKGDVYSYGIVLLEMFTGKRPTDNMFTDNFNLHNHVKMAAAEQVMESVDPSLISEGPTESNRTTGSSRGNVVRTLKCLGCILQIGVMCSADLPSERMNIGDALNELQVIRDVYLGKREMK